jgi:hypothetical protein
MLILTSIGDVLKFPHRLMNAPGAAAAVAVGCGGCGCGDDHHDVIWLRTGLTMRVIDAI